ncbi:MAG: BamA/OMP85 family outer membrane protein [Candidatus Cyclobacteriaceae bacterium M3_2C_046]
MLSELAMAQFPFRRRQTNKVEIDYSKPPQEYTIADIEIIGLETLDKNAVISLTELKVGDQIRIPGEATSTALNKLWKNGIIGDATIYVSKIEGEQVYLTIEVQERPRLTRFSFEGVNKTQQTELSEEVDLIRGRVLTDALIKNTELSIKKYFVEKGYLNTEIDIQKIRDTLFANGVRMVIDVDKKSKVKINKINIHGNEAFDDARIKKKMKKVNEHIRFNLFRDLANAIFRSKPKEIASFIVNKEKEETDFQKIKTYLNNNVKLNIFGSSKFIKDEYEEDKDNIIAFYNSRGFRDAVIVDDSVYRHSDNSINVDITVDEGAKYYFRDIIWTGNYVYPDSLLDKVLGIRKGDVYDLELVQKKLTFDPTGTDISSLYMDDGYLFFNVQPVEVRIEDDSIDLEMRMYEGQQATISNVVIKGNDRTNDHVILREIRTLPGDKFNRSELIRTQRELSQLGYFDPEQIGIQPIPNPVDGTVDIEYTLVEKPSDQIELSGGWGGFVGFVGTLGIVFNNFSVKNIPKFENWRPLPVGDGQRLSLRAQANGRFFQNYNFSFTEPWLGGTKPNSFSISYNHSVQRSNPAISRLYGFGDAGVNRSFVMDGITLSLGRRVTWPDDFFTVSNSFSFLRYNLENWGLARGVTDGIFNNFTFNTTIARNSINQPMFPRFGSSLSLSVSLTPPYSILGNKDIAGMSDKEKYEWVEYHKWMFDAKHYVTLVGDLVLEAKAHMGFIGAYNNELGIGPFERFVMGGSGLAGTTNQWQLGTDIISMRGYTDNTTNSTNRDDITPVQPDGIIGGTIYNKFGLELRYPLSLKPAATIYVLGFAEAGNNWNNFEEYNPFKMFRTAGVGARIFMPAFGLLGIDYGIGFDSIEQGGSGIGNIFPREQRFQFTIGQQFR